MGSSGLTTVLFTDLVGSTEIFQSLTEEQAETFRRKHFGLLRKAVAAHGGEEVKNLGDGLMVVFDRAGDALRAATEIVRAVRQDNATEERPAAHVRVGVQTGEPQREGGDYFGTPVIVAKRLCDLAGPDQILAGDVATAVAAQSADVRLHPVGALSLKGIKEPVDAAVVAWWSPEEDGRWPITVPTAAPRVTRPPTLAPPPDAFVGRDADLAELTDLLSSARMVTITGPGGIGKTRISGHLVDAVAHRYPDGVWCAALAPVTNDENVPAAVASALLVERRENASLAERLVEFLAPKKSLLVLDNCEQVIDGAADLASVILAGTSRVDVLATSREPLGISGEHRFRLEPLRLTDSAGGPSAAGMLFAQRAGAANRALGLDAAADTMEEICRALDGLPLAIELAAARAGSHSLAEIAVEVSERLDQLSTRRGKPERHRSVHAAVDWSYDLLEEDEQQFFERLAVFAAGWELDAAIAVCPQSNPRRVREHLDRLVDSSLVVTRPAGEVTRYSLLEPIRAYATQRFAGRPDHRDTLGRHADFFVTLVEEADRGFRRAEGRAWMDRLTRDLPNLHSAHAWLLADGDVERSLRLVGGLGWYGFSSSQSQIFRWAEDAVEHWAETGRGALAEAYGTAAVGAGQRGDLVRALELSAKSEAHAGDDPARARIGVLISAGVSMFRGQFDEACHRYERVTQLSVAAGDVHDEVVGRACTALVLGYAGRAEEAKRVGDEAVARALADGNAAARAWAYYGAGEARLDSDPVAARDLLNRALAEAEAVGNGFLLAVAGLSALSLESRAGDPHAALRRYPPLIEHWQRSGSWTHQWLTLRTLVETLTRAGHPEPAAVLHGAAAASATASPVVGADAVRQTAVIAELRDRLGEDGLAELIARGAALGDTGAVAYATEILRELVD